MDSNVKIAFVMWLSMVGIMAVKLMWQEWRVKTKFPRRFNW